MIENNEVKGECGSMGEQTFVKKKLAILLIVCFVLSVTAGVVSALIGPSGCSGTQEGQKGAQEGQRQGTIDGKGDGKFEEGYGYTPQNLTPPFPWDGKSTDYKYCYKQAYWKTYDEAYKQYSPTGHR